MQRREALKRTALIFGSAVAIPPLASALKGCSPAEVETYTPVFLTKEQFKTVSVMADRILPNTDTVGAIDVGADRFIDLILNECYATEEQSRFRAGLDKLNSNISDQMFHDLDEEAQIDYLTLLDVNEENTDLVFMYRVVKELTVHGYFSSEEGIKQNFNYLPVPGKYEACVTIGPEDKPWRGGRL